MPRPQRAHSLQDLRHIKAALQANRIQRAQEQEQERQKQQRLRQEHSFAAAFGPARPLRGDHAQRVRHLREPVPPQPRQRERDQAAVLQEALSDDFDACSLLETDEQLSYSRAGLAPDVVRKLRQGHWSIQRQIDLHGLRRDAAREQLSAFIRECHGQGIRCVRVVTGKGLGSPNRVPVLKHKTRNWLVQKQEVLAFVQACPADGGSDALIVLLDRPR